MLPLWRINSRQVLCHRVVGILSLPVEWTRLLISQDTLVNSCEIEACRAQLKINLRRSSAEMAISRTALRRAANLHEFLLTADQMFTPNLNDRIAQFNLVTRLLATVSRHLAQVSALDCTLARI